jgi:NAD(P)-dependent dehydrogenase (short-subunit alcohol dehydrogenase family)
MMEERGADGLKIRGSVALVTGAAAGIGAALAAALIDRGASVVVLTDLDGAAVDRAAAALRVPGAATEVLAAALDVGDASALRARIAAIESAYGRVDLICSNAGIGTGAGIDAPVQTWQRAWDINLMAHVHAADAALPGMLARGRGALLQTCSAAGLLTVAGEAPYAVTKHAAVALAEWMALTYGDRGITVTALCPLGVETGMLAAEDLLATRFVRATGRVIAPADVAAVALDAVEAGDVLALPHPEVEQMEHARVADRGVWLTRLRAAVTAIAGQGRDASVAGDFDPSTRGPLAP